MTHRLPPTDPHGSLDLRDSGVPATLVGKIREAIKSSVPLLIEGEPGTGKTYLAQLIHDLGPRAGKPFVPQNCGALAEGVFEAEVFGHTRGAFTGATQARRGLIEAANQGTLFLDEIAELRLHHQAALLDVLDHGRLRLVGSNQLVRVNVRSIFATNQDLAGRVREGKFRRDLYHRCAALYLYLPPLRERRHEIPSVVTRILESIVRQARSQSDRELGRIPQVSPNALSLVCNHPLPGNFRDLEHALRLAVSRCNGGHIEPEHLRDVLDRLEHLAFLIDRPATTDSMDPDLLTPGQEPRQASRKWRKPRYVRPEDPTDEKRNIQKALACAAGNKSEAARALGMTRQTLHARMHHLHIDDNETPTEPRS